jgi:hypothetical protein
VVIASYANSFVSGFVIDSKVIVLGDPRLRAVTWGHLYEIVVHSYWWPYAETGLYRPVTTLSYLFNYSVLGEGAQPAGYHVVNLALHLGNAFLLLALARRFGASFWLAFTAAAVWATHPILTEAVTNIVGRADLLSAFGVLGALYCLLRWRENAGRQLAWIAGTVICSCLAVGAKESGAALLGVVVLHDVLIGEWRDWRERAGSWMAVAIPLAIYLAARASVVGGLGTVPLPVVDNPIAGAGFWTGRVTALAVAGRYLGSLVWPAGLSADYSFSQIPLASGTGGEWAAWLAVAAIAAAAVGLLRKAPAVSFALASAFLLWLPASNLLFASGTIMAERLVYLPSAGLIVAAVAGAWVLLSRRPASALAGVGVAAALVGLFGVRTFARNADWRDDLSIWQATVRSAPGSFKAHSGYAEALYQSVPSHENLEAVIAEKDQSLAILETSRAPESAIRQYREAATYALERAEQLEATGTPSAEADEAFEKAATLARRYLDLLPRARALANPPSSRDESDVYLLLASATSRLHDDARAVEAARSGRAARPFEASSYRAEASALLAAHDTEGAAVALMTGFMVTGDTGLRDALIAIYRSGLDAEGCAVTEGASGTVLNQACGVVRRHLCAASALAAATYDRADRRALAEQTQATAVSVFGCAPP